MATISRISCVWQQWPGAPGVTQFYADDAATLQDVVDDIRAFFEAIKALLPSGLTISVPGNGDNLNDVTGQISGAWSVGVTPTVVTCTGVGAYAGNAGAVVHWLTGGTINGRRVRGRTFLVPLINTAYDTSGSISTAALATLQTAANGLVTGSGGDLVVWHRPTNFAGGSSFQWNGNRIPDLAVSLRSRRI